MKAIVTGGAGFIGTNLIVKLLEDKWTVVSLDNYSTGLRENQQEGCDYLETDISEVIPYIGTPDVIFHIGALARIQPSLTDPLPHIKNNFVSTLNILEYARENNIEVIYAGSSSKHHGLYGSPYAWSKYGGEELCKLYSEVYDLNTTICRFYNVYGDYMIMDGAYATVIAIFQQQYLGDETLTITGNGEQRRDFTHVDDIVDGLIRCVGRDNKAKYYELGTGKNYSINEVGDMFNHRTKYIPARPGEYDVTLCDYSTAENEIGYKPTGNLENYINQWLGENK